jgi:hypothetical protein
MVFLPWSFTDPGYGCFPPSMLSMAGGKPQKVRCAFFQYKFTLGDAYEFHAFAPLEALPCV